MGSSGEDYSVIGDKGEIGFIDYENDKSVFNYNPEEEGAAIISVPFPLVDGKPQSVFVGETAVDSITLRNTTDAAIDIWGMNIYASSPEDTFTLSLMKPPSADSGVEEIEEFLEFFRMEDRLLQPFEILTLWVSCKPKQIGLHTSVVQFSVGDDIIERVIFLLAEDKITQSLTSRKPYMKGMKKKQFPVNVYVDGQRPVRKTNLTYRNRLPRYDIPEHLREPIENKEIPDAIYRGLTRKNYVAYFEALLIMEEIELEECMKRYAMERVTMKTKMNHFLTLEVPGLAERRPSLVHGDQVFVKLAREDANNASPPYQGYIHHVEAEEIYLKFARDFHMRHRDKNHYDVQFAYNRINMRRLYQAITATGSLDTGFLFPSTSSERRLTKSSAVTPISMKLNAEQMRSVEMILRCKGAPPYVIHGPPGTGKTVTLVEAILQLYTTREDTRILVCAPSNSAADYLLEKLISEEVEVKENEIFRLNATTRTYEDVKPDFIRFCYFDDHIFKCPPLELLMRYRIIISTYMSASLLYAEGMKHGHLSHIFLDEAGQASEPETMIPISSLSQRNTVLVLAGDPMQLGPVVHSSEAEFYGLGKSYMERIFESPLYSNGDNNYITKLVRNYRCHPEILRLPSLLFYEGQLVACREDATSFTSWSKSLPELFPNEEFPVLFLGIQGCDEREGKNPSWFNRFEISKVVEVIKKLAEKANFNGEDIGVITPYRQQVNKIKDILEGLEMPNIKVGSVEQFQGQERKVIIISTVRSTFKHNGFDKLFCLGFLTNPKRFNVAITRAISSLIIVGNPHIISKDPFWNQLLWQCADNNSYRGCQLPERQVISEEEPLQEGSWKYEQEGNIQDSQYGWGQESSWKYEGEGNQQISQYEWSQEPLPDIPKPVTDEAEWSDGWK